MREVTITYYLNEDVTPHIFAGKAAWAAGYGLLREGESLVCDGVRYTIEPPDTMSLGGDTRVEIPSYSTAPDTGDTSDIPRTTLYPTD